MELSEISFIFSEDGNKYSVKYALDKEKGRFTFYSAVVYVNSIGAAKFKSMRTTPSKKGAIRLIELTKKGLAK